MAVSDSNETGRPIVTCLRRILVVVADIDAAAQFFAEAFAFEIVERHPADPSLSQLLGLPDRPVRQTILRLGAQEIGLLAFDPPGRPVPPDSGSTDLWFQHFAIIVADIGAAYARLQATGGFTPISTHGPQALPPGSGSVTAYKFRDRDGHPLELLAFPAGQEPDAWRDKADRYKADQATAKDSAGPAVFLGIDHSAIAVSDTARSIAFYEACFGLRRGAQTLNQGVAQARLDNVPDASVTVTGLEPAEATPHVELLCYGIGSRRPSPADRRADDGAATVMVLQTASLEAIVAALRAAAARFVSPGIVTLAGGEKAVAILDPDGHRIVVMQ